MSSWAGRWMEIVISSAPIHQEKKEMQKER
jgi:hypothetical protein